MATLAIREATQAGKTAKLTGERMLITLIDAGQGSSGYYPAETLEAAGAANVFPVGTHMYIDHPGEFEEGDRPERTIKDLAAVLNEDAYYDPDKQALVAEATVFKTWRETLAEMKDNIGVSIRAFAEFDGNVVTRLIEALSVDFVTFAGRGGKIQAILESQRVARETVESDFAERLNKAVNLSWPDNYVRDYDKEAGLAYIYSWNDQKYYEASFEVSGVEVSVSAERFEVVPETHYMRVGSTAESEENKVADTNAELVAEAKVALEAKVAALETEVATLKADNEKLKAEKAEVTKTANESQGKEILTRVLGEAELPQATKDKIEASAVIGADFDAVAFEAMLSDEIKREGEYVSKILGAGKLSGFGSESNNLQESGFRTAWGREIK